MNAAITKRNKVRFAISILTVLLLPVLLLACASPSRLHASRVPEGSLRTAEVTYLAPRSEIMNVPDLLETMRVSGIDQSELVDGSVGEGRVFCCGGPNETGEAIWFYIPRAMQVELGDIVEVRSGPPVMQGDPMKGPPNTVMQVRQRQSDTSKQCRWTPEDPNLWKRVIYCDWMKQEGWIQQEGLWDVWIKQP